MELSAHWLTTPVLDAEYKRYKLLAFLKYVDEHYFERRLFPYADQVRMHTDSLLSFASAMEELSATFPKDLIGVDLRQFMLNYDTKSKLSSEMIEIERIIEGALPLLKSNLDNAYELIEKLKSHIELFPIGLLPLEVQYGYLLLQHEPGTRVYEYRLNKVAQNDDPFAYRSISTRYIDTWKRSPSNNFEQIKLDLLKRKNAVANPATFGFVSNLSLPHIETFLPLAKQMAYKVLSEKAV